MSLVNRKQPVAKYREYQKKRKLAKQQRFKQLEEEREVEKNKWLAFATKVRYTKYFYTLLIHKFLRTIMVNLINLPKTKPNYV